jgi:hypothetical protein
MTIGGIQQELDALAGRLGRSLTIDSVEGDLIAYSTQRDDVDEARISSILRRHVAPEIRQWQHRHVGADTREPVTIPANPALGMAMRVCVPLRRGDRTLGFLWLVDSAESLTELDRDALRRGADALAGQLGATRDDAGVLVRRLFDDGHPDAYHRLALAVPAIVDGPVRVVAVVVPGREGARQFHGTEFSALSGSLSTRLRGSPGFVGSSVSTAYALVVLHDHPRDALGDIDRAVAACLPPGTSFTLGVSDAVTLDAHSAGQARREALTAAELAGLDPALDRLSSWSALGAYRLLLATTQPMDQVLRPLDGAGGSAPMLLETLETFLDLAGEIRTVAARLNLHRSSLYYRLDRIGQLLGADLSNGLTRLELHMAVKARRMRRRKLT